MASSFSTGTLDGTRPDPFYATSTDISNTSEAKSSHISSLPSIPELFNPGFLDAILPPSPPRCSDDFGNRTVTLNDSPAYISTLSPTLDLFSVGPNANGTELHSLLEKSWASSPDLTLRLIFSLRSIHEGKAEKDTFYKAYGWLYKSHPRTAISNLPQLVGPIIDRAVKRPDEDEVVDSDKADAAPPKDDGWSEVEAEKKDYRLGYSHGYYKDLLNILTLAVTDQLTDPGSTFPALYSARPNWTLSSKDRARRRGTLTPQGARNKDKNEPGEKLTKRQKRALRTEPPETPQALAQRIARGHHARLVTKLKSSFEFRALYVAVARIFGSKLAEEVSILHRITYPKEPLTEEERMELSFKIGLASKWAPSLGMSHDRMTNITTAIALVLQCSGAMSDLPIVHNPGQELSAEDTAKIRGFYRRWILSPLRRHSHIPEVYMSAQKWDQLRYTCVPSICMKNSKTLFFKHDEERFKKYLADVSSGKKSISGATLGPHELLHEVMSIRTNDPAEREMNETVINSQFNALIDRLRESGSLDNCLALCDVSGSMGSFGYSSAKDPIYPAVALSIVVAKLARPPFQNTFITFSQSPELIQLNPTHSLSKIAQHMVSTNWDMNTDLQAVFLRLILPLAIKHKVKKEDMVKRLFIFSDMQFDQCHPPSSYEWKTDHDMISEAYRRAGYDVPELVYWNLAKHLGASKPITAGQAGVALLSGFSSNLLKVFMDGPDELQKKLEQMEIVDESGETTSEKKDVIDSIDVMMKAISKKSFDGLRVID
ncbi:hypothetical protein BS47DRAFT_1342097 [Hydnum rufescens UP504]|uniref:Uncharacterized protein n=1 Tax=Hydnum rufescens UP504 TaxID=1448309 RepID=A0A9P6DYR5_9AGAM|nr:hypothetical protein BS47DRAFT_1342097 [Hydnum rufescens UP504]